MSNDNSSKEGIEFGLGPRPLRCSACKRVVSERNYKVVEGKIYGSTCALRKEKRSVQR